jgi:hypothetical protein
MSVFCTNPMIYVKFYILWAKMNVLSDFFRYLPHKITFVAIRGNHTSFWRTASQQANHNEPAEGL